MTDARNSITCTPDARSTSTVSWRLRKVVGEAVFGIAEPSQANGPADPGLIGGGGETGCSLTVFALEIPGSPHGVDQIAYRPDALEGGRQCLRRENMDGQYPNSDSASPMASSMRSSPLSSAFSSITIGGLMRRMWPAGIQAKPFAKAFW